MEYEIKSGPQGHYYIPKKIREVFGSEIKLAFNNKAGVIYPQNANLREVVLSLQIMIQDLKLRAGMISMEVKGNE